MYTLIETTSNLNHTYLHIPKPHTKQRMCASDEGVQVSQASQIHTDLNHIDTNLNHIDLPVHIPKPHTVQRMRASEVGGIG